jgi:hypothetical protein
MKCMICSTEIPNCNPEDFMVEYMYGCCSECWEQHQLREYFDTIQKQIDELEENRDFVVREYLRRNR